MKNIMNSRNQEDRDTESYENRDCKLKEGAKAEERITIYNCFVFRLGKIKCVHPVYNAKSHQKRVLLAFENVRFN